MKAVELYRSVPRYVTARTLSGRLPHLQSVAVGSAPLRMADRPGFPPPAREGWARVRPRLSGICGSDLATVTGRSSFYFSPLVSLPFTPGHEVVGDLLDDLPGMPAGTRVVVEPVLGCAARGLDPACPACAAGSRSRCERVTLGHLAPGLQTGFCADTGGGWSPTLVAHQSQLHPVPADLPDERAVLAEPLACAVHVARRAEVAPGQSVLVIGAGAVGLLTLLALRALTPAGRVSVVAKHPKQAVLARRLGADDVLAPDAVLSGVRRQARAVRCEPERGSPYLLGGVDVSIDATGAASGLDLALRVTRAGGRVVLAGMPAGSVDLTPLWFRELALVGAYATGGDDMRAALDLLATAPVDGFVAAPYPLRRWRDALDHAASAGRLGTVKVAFDPRIDPRPDTPELTRRDA